MIIIDNELNDDWIKQLPSAEQERELFALPLSVLMSEGGPGSGHYGHAGRPGKVGGGMASAGSGLTDYLDFVANVSVRSKEAVVLEHGQFFEPQPLPKKYQYGQAKLCFMNAYQLAYRTGLQYAEGFAFPDFLEIPIHHAWVVDQDGKVLDNTWKKPGTAYFGIAFDADFVEKVVVETGEYGVLTFHSQVFRDQYLNEVAEGSSTSGHYGHAGRPGQRGGSASGSSSIRVPKGYSEKEGYELAHWILSRKPGSVAAVPSPRTKKLSDDVFSVMDDGESLGSWAAQTVDSYHIQKLMDANPDLLNDSDRANLEQLAQSRSMYPHYFPGFPSPYTVVMDDAVGRNLNPDYLGEWGYEKYGLIPNDMVSVGHWELTNQGFVIHIAKDAPKYGLSYRNIFWHEFGHTLAANDIERAVGPMKPNELAGDYMDRFAKQMAGEAVTEGSASSGNYGHAGRPGMVGGSSSGSNRGGFVDSMAKHTQDGKWSQERQVLHQEIINSFFAGKTPVAEPVSYMLGGGPASGKSTVANAMDLPDNIVMAAGDEVKAMLPEYQVGLKAGEKDVAGWVHEESSYLAKKVMAQAASGGYNVMLDGTGDSTIEKILQKVNALKARGQRVVGIYVTVNFEEAMRRMIARGKQTGRYIPETVMHINHASVSRVFPKIISGGIMDQLFLYDTGSGSPLLLAEYADGEFTVLQPAEYQAFLDKGN